MNYIGIAAVLFSMLCFSKEYSHKQYARLKECEGFLAFFLHMRMQVGCFLRPSRELADGFSNNALSKLGFLDALRNRGSLFAAYEECESRMALSLAEKEIIVQLFKSVGEGYLDEGMRLIESACKEMKSISQDLKREVPKSVKIANALTAAVSLGIIILVI